MDKMELIETDPATGEELELLSTGSAKKVAAKMGYLMADAIANAEGDYKIRMRIQPAN